MIWKEILATVNLPLLCYCWQTYLIVVLYFLPILHNYPPSQDSRQEARRPRPAQVLQRALGLWPRARDTSVWARLPPARLQRQLLWPVDKRALKQAYSCSPYCVYFVLDFNVRAECFPILSEINIPVLWKLPMALRDMYFELFSI